MNRLSHVIALVLVASALSAWSPPAAAATLHEVSGKVVSDQGRPLEGVLVYGHTYDREGGGTEDKATTGAAGAFTLHLAAGKGYVNVRYEPWGAGEGRDVLVDGNVTDLVFTLRTPPPKTAIVQGRVLDAEGNPVEGATVRLDQGCCYAYETTYDTAVSEGEATEPAPAEPEPAAGADGREATTTASSPAMIRPMPAPCCYDASQETRTGADGAYRFATYPGPRQLSASAPGYAHTNVQVEAKDNATLTQDLVLVKVPPADAVLEGRVLDARTGLPVANAQVSLSNLEWSRWEHAVTGADGAFRIQTLPGWSQLTVHAYGYAPDEPVPLLAEDADAAAVGVAKPAPSGQPGKSYYQHLQTLRLRSGETSLDVALEPKPPADVVLQGYVVDPDAKKGVPGAHVNVWNQDTGDWGSATTDATGSYRILVRAGHYTATSWAEGHLAGGTSFTIAEGETLKRVDIESPAGQTRYAPCADCDARIAYAESGVAAKGAPAPAAAPMAAADEASSGTGSRGEAYAGSGGGLPAYSPDEAAQPAAARPLEPANQVPAPGLPAALAAVGLALAVLARRRA